MSTKYIPTTWVGAKTVATADVMNNMEKGISDAHDRLDGVDEQFNTIQSNINMVSTLFIKNEDETNNDCLNRLFNDLNSTGGTILLPKGTILLNPFTLPKNIKLKGQGQNVTILKLNDNCNSDFITIDASQYAGIFDLTIHGNKASNTSGSGLVITNTVGEEQQTNSRNLKIDNINIVGCAEHGLKCVKQNNVWIFQLRFIKIDSCEGYGIWNNCTDNSFYMIDIYNCKKGAMYDVGNNNRVVGGKWYCCGDITGNSNTYTLNSQANRTIYSDIELQDNYGTGIKLENCNDVILTGIVVDSCGVLTSSPTSKYGLTIYNSNNINFNGSLCNYKGATIKQAYGVLVNEGCSYIELNCYVNDTQITTPFSINKLANNVNTKYYNVNPHLKINNTIEQVISPSSFTKINLSNILSKNGFDYLNGDITSYNKGNFILDFNIVLRVTSSPTQIKIYLYKNNNVYKKLYVSNISDSDIINCNTVVELSKNDILDLRMWGNNQITIPSNEPSCGVSLIKL